MRIGIGCNATAHWEEAIQARGEIREGRHGSGYKKKEDVAETRRPNLMLVSEPS